MLPALPTPPVLRRALPALALALVLALPLGLLGGCGLLRSQPPQRVLLDALALQIQLTQGAIARALELEAVGLPQVSRVRVEQQEPVRIGEARGLHLRGRFDWRLVGDPIRVDSPFELWLAQGERGESWRLALPSGAAADERQQWITHPLPLPG
jgi:hypothetical protein